MRLATASRPRLGGYRSGFTLVEIMVVLAIIGVLVTLAAAASFQFIGAQRQSNTELILQTIAGQLHEQWSAVVKKASTEPIPEGVGSMAGGDPSRARVIWIKLRLKQEFPMSFAEAKAPWATASAVNPFVNQAVLPSRYKVLASVPAGSVPRPSESSACLLLALQQARGGPSRFNADTLRGMGAIADTDQDGIEEIVDAWGIPLAFCRWPTANVDVAASNPAPGNPRRDNLDPDGLLLRPDWNNPNNFNSPFPLGGVRTFEQLCHPVHLIDNNKWLPTAFYSVPTVVSAGRNKTLGLDPVLLGQTDASADDNLYSFRLRLGGRGD
jgi:prepilin-type N-terminal cleavage/methylation domain-containing protein